MRRAVAALLLVMLAAGAAALVLTRRNAPERDRPEITRGQLVRLGVDLGPPDPDQPVVVARERAERAARSATSSPVLGSVLATCFDGEDEVGYPCWAVAHDPAGHVSSGPRGTQRIPAAYYVSIVDSRTGEWVGARMGSGGGSLRSRADREVAKEAVEQAVRDLKRRSVVCHDDVRPDFRGRPAFGCTVGTGQAAKDGCYALLGHNLFRMSCFTAHTDAARLVRRGKK